VPQRSDATRRALVHAALNEDGVISHGGHSDEDVSAGNGGDPLGEGSRMGVADHGVLEAGIEAGKDLVWARRGLDQPESSLVLTRN
jgi:hypothetical protein